MTKRIIQTHVICVLLWFSHSPKFLNNLKIMSATKTQWNNLQPYITMYHRTAEFRDAFLISYASHAEGNILFFFLFHFPSRIIVATLVNWLTAIDLSGFWPMELLLFSWQRFRRFQTRPRLLLSPRMYAVSWQPLIMTWRIIITLCIYKTNLLLRSFPTPHLWEWVCHRPLQP